MIYRSIPCTGTHRSERLMAADAPTALLPDARRADRARSGGRPGSRLRRWVPARSVVRVIQRQPDPRSAPPSQATRFVPSYVGRLSPTTSRPAVMHERRLLASKSALQQERPEASWAPAMRYVADDGQRQTGRRLLVDGHAVQRLVAGGRGMATTTRPRTVLPLVRSQKRRRTGTSSMRARTQPRHDGGGDGRRDGFNGVRCAGGNRDRGERDRRRCQRNRVFQRSR